MNGTGASSTPPPACERTVESEAGSVGACLLSAGHRGGHLFWTPSRTQTNVVWLRSWPSGHVHAVSRFSVVEGTPATRCGICWPGKRWTEEYPAGCQTCVECERRVGPRPFASRQEHARG